MRCGWTPIMCGGPTRSFSGRGQPHRSQRPPMERIASKLAAASPVLREYCASTDASGVAGILGDSPEAAQWSPPTEAEMSGSGLVHILVSEAGELESAFQLVGYISARQVADEGEILNLAVRRSWRRRGAGAQLLRGMLRRLLRTRLLAFIWKCASPINRPYRSTKSTGSSAPGGGGATIAIQRRTRCSSSASCRRMTRCRGMSAESNTQASTELPLVSA